MFPRASAISWMVGRSAGSSATDESLQIPVEIGRHLKWPGRWHRKRLRLGASKSMLGSTPSSCARNEGCEWLSR